MEKIIQALNQIQDWENKFRLYNVKNNLQNNPIIRLQPQNIESLTKHLLKLSEENDEKYKISWVSSQYQALEIILTAISVLTDKTIEEFNNSEWSVICEIFPYKLPLTVKYESLRIIMEKKQQRRRWCAPEEIFLIEIVKNLTKQNKWNDVARQLFIRSQGEFFRQGKHCRERWINHLHPSIQNNHWTPVQDIKLLSFILKKGKKWAKIAKKFDMKRSQCMVKKRFYELINIEEQDSLPIETLKNYIRATLNRLRSQFKEKNEELREADLFQQIVDKNQRKSSISKETFKTDILGTGMAIQAKVEQNENMMPEPCQQNPCSSLGSSNMMPSASLLNVNDHQNVVMTAQNYLSYYLNYMDMLRGMINPIYIQYPQVIVPIQNNIIITQGSQQLEEFHKF